MLRSTGESTVEHCSRFKKAPPNLDNGLNCFFGSTTNAFPGITPSVSPCITAMKRSVVGSGPIRIPGKSRSSRYLIGCREEERYQTSEDSDMFSMVLEVFGRRIFIDGGSNSSNECLKLRLSHVCESSWDQSSIIQSTERQAIGP